MIKDEGYTITDVPGVESVKVQPDRKTVEIVIKFHDGTVMEYGLDRCEELASALERAASLGRSMTAQNERE